MDVHAIANIGVMRKRFPPYDLAGRAFPAFLGDRVRLELNLRYATSI